MDIGDLKSLMEQAEGAFSDEERRILGFDADPDDFEQRLNQQGVVLQESVMPLQGKEADGEVVIYFDDFGDAQVLYDFVVESRLVVPGEIKIKHIEGQHSVHFSPEVYMNKPEVILMAMEAYEDMIEGESDEAYESFMGDLEDRVSERFELFERSGLAKKSKGAIKKKKGDLKPVKPYTTYSGAPMDKAKGNPFHDADTGKSTTGAAISKREGGSWSNGKTKLKHTKTGQNKSGGPDIAFAGTKHPCGRAARKKGLGKNYGRRCWDSNIPSWVNRASESLRSVLSPSLISDGRSMGDRIVMAELRSYLQAVDSLQK